MQSTQGEQISERTDVIMHSIRAFNDRRKERKATSSTTRAQIGAMANSGTLRATKAPTPGSTEFNSNERSAVKQQVKGTYDGSSRKEKYATAAKNVSNQSDVRGYDAPAYRTMQEPGSKEGKK
jgi:hypothetical protein